MTILGIGVDIENSLRFKTRPYDNHEHFYNKIFSKQEIKYCLSKSRPYIHFSGKFSAKEAVLKASQEQGLGFKDIEILNSEENNAPYVLIRGKAETNILISISHSGLHSIAFSIINKRGENND